MEVGNVEVGEWGGVLICMHGINFTSFLIASSYRYGYYLQNTSV